jgi:hypothetical protein
MKTFKIPDDFCFVFKKITNHLQLFFFISFWKTPLKHLTYFSICSINYKVQSGVARRRGKPILRTSIEKAIAIS